MFWSGKDAVSRDVHLAARPERILSLVPSQTELLVDLGVGARLVGRTRYCIHPENAVASIPVVGGTKQMDLQKIQSLKPDFILAEKEETPKEWVEALSELAPVYVTDVVSIASAISMVETVGQLVGLGAEGSRLAQEIREQMDSVRGICRAQKVLYLIWKKPWMGVGRDTFIDSCLEHLGFQNVLAASLPGAWAWARYPELNLDRIRDLNPDRVFLSSEPYPFAEKHRAEILEVLPRARVELVNGELFSWYGSRMLKMPAYWRQI